YTSSSPHRRKRRDNAPGELQAGIDATSETAPPDGELEGSPRLPSKPGSVRRFGAGHAVDRRALLVDLVVDRRAEELETSHRDDGDEADHDDVLDHVRAAG